MELKQTLLICMCSALLIKFIQCSNGDNSSNAAKLDAALAAIRKKSVVNCSIFIPEEIQQLMRENDPPNLPNAGQMFALVEYLLACLQTKLPNVGDSSPFALLSNPTIAYNVGLNQVVSLGFDGILTTKALIDPYNSLLI